MIGAHHGGEGLLQERRGPSGTKARQSVDDLSMAGCLFPRLICKNSCVKKECHMNQSASRASAGTFLDSYDFNQNYHYLKKLIQDLKVENSTSVRKEIFGEDERECNLTKKQMKQLFRFLRKIEHHYEECCSPPIPEELENSIRDRDSSEWLPWELEAIEKVDGWREELEEKRRNARQMLHSALEKVRKGEEIPGDSPAKKGTRLH
jgi:hypothetical protein